MYNQPGRNERYAADRTAEDLEGQNDDALQGLSQKVKLLKNVRSFLLLFKVVRSREGVMTSLPFSVDHHQHW